MAKASVAVSADALTVEDLEGLLEEAADTLRRLAMSGRSPTTKGCSWPDPAVYAAAEWLTYGNGVPRGRLAPPDAEAIDRMDRTLSWMSSLATLHLLGTEWNRIIWARANLYSYQRIADMLAWKTRRPWSWSTVRRRHHDAMGALLEIARRDADKQAA